MTACDDCLRRTDLVAAIAGRLEVEWKTRDARARVLALPDEELIGVGAGEEVGRRYARFDPPAARAAAAAAGLKTVCRCRPGYPQRLHDLPDPPAVLHVLGDTGALRDPGAVAVVGARRASAYGIEVARALGRGLSAARVPVVSGLALGIDSAAHAGALDAPGATIGVLAGSAEVPYPARGRLLHAAVARRGAIVSELPPGTRAFRWCFVARNRIIAALGAVTVIVQAAERSGSLTTADFAAELGRGVAAVPGQVTSRLSAGVHALIQAGAPLVTSVADILELLAETTGVPAEPATPITANVPEYPAEGALRDVRGARLLEKVAARASANAGESCSGAVAAEVPRELVALLSAVEDGRGTLGELAGTPEEARAALAGLGRLERLGLVSRGLDGRWRRSA